jgi:hypothetical protein
MMPIESLAKDLASLTSPAHASGLPRFRWLPGMRITEPTGALYPKRVSDVEVAARVTFMGWLPDLTDRLTVLSLIILVQDAWGPALQVSIDMCGCVTLEDENGEQAIFDMDMVFDGGTDAIARALVAALEDAP